MNRPSFTNLSVVHFRDAIELTKPRLSFLVIITCASGVWLAPYHSSLLNIILIILATTCIVASANTFNSYIERDSDALMERTKMRPLPSHKITPQYALRLGIILLVIATPILFFSSNFLSTLLAIIAFFSYVFIYTPLKKKTTLALFIGAIPGALPPVIGFTSMTNKINLVALSLFAILFVWQLPHFLAISLYLKKDYMRGGFKVFSVCHGDTKTKISLLISVAILIPISYLPTFLGIANSIYGFFSIVLGVLFFVLTLKGFLKKSDDSWARHIFFISIIYLTLLFAILIINKINY